MRVRESVRRPLMSQTFGRFIRLPENRAARIACVRLPSAVLKRRRPSATLTFLHGPPGTGKSHLAQVLVEHIGAVAPDRMLRIVSARDLGKLAAGQTLDEANHTGKFRLADWLVVEDMQHLPSSTAAAMVSLLDKRQSRRLPTLLTASVGPMALRGLPSRLTSRLASGLVVRIKAFSQPSLQKLARCWCGQRAFRLDEAVITWLVGRSRTGARSLLGDLARLHQLSREHRLSFDAEIAKRLLGENMPQDSPIEAVAEAVAASFHLTVQQLRLRDRRGSLIWPRQIAAYAARRKTKLSLASIGAFFGRCNHTTALHAIRKVEERVSRDANFAREIEELLSCIGESRVQRASSD